MYTLIADSGSTKTDWILLNGSNVVKQIKTMGFNPYFQTKEQICLELLSNLKPYLQEFIARVDVLHYYGAGCSTLENCLLIEDCLSITLNLKKINVSHDLLAAARALCKKEKGIACILGTGSNSCLFNGKHIIENVPSVGYLWGDYGSGAQIGKYFVQDYFEGKIPLELSVAFEAEGYEREEILNHVYKGTMPSRYLANISHFAFKHILHPYIHNLLVRCFNSFFEHQISKYTKSKEHKVNTVGSIGFVYKDVFKEVAEKYGYKIGNVIKSPLEGLIEYHSS
ncbi:MAG: ATPase [Sphingobacteriaceae bacterium]|nr:ATPase [Sphingobacteriaceae bacterium]